MMNLSLLLPKAKKSHLVKILEMCWVKISRYCLIFLNILIVFDWGVTINICMGFKKPLQILNNGTCTTETTRWEHTLNTTDNLNKHKKNEVL